MNVLDVAAEVLYRLVARFTVISVGVIYVPENSEIVTGKAVKHIPEPCGVGIYAARFNEQADADALCIGNDRGENLIHCLIAVIQSAHDDVWNASVVGNIHKRLYGVDILGGNDGHIRNSLGTLLGHLPSAVNRLGVLLSRGSCTCNERGYLEVGVIV